MKNSNWSPCTPFSSAAWGMLGAWVRWCYYPAQCQQLSWSHRSDTVSTVAYSPFPFFIFPVTLPSLCQLFPGTWGFLLGMLLPRHLVLLSYSLHSDVTVWGLPWPADHNILPLIPLLCVLSSLHVSSSSMTHNSLWYSLSPLKCQLCLCCAQWRVPNYDRPHNMQWVLINICRVSELIEFLLHNVLGFT